MANFIWPLTPINPGNIKFSNDGVSTDVSIDTSVPANSTPLPVRQLNADGTVYDPSVAEGYLQTLTTIDYATEATLSSIDTKVATEATLQTLATEATVSTLATEATVSTLATEATLEVAKDAVVSIDNKVATEATLLDIFNDVGSILQNQLSTVDSSNTTDIPLGANATYTGTAIDITNFATVSVAAFSDVSSATDGLKMEFSPDGINWDHIHSFSVTGNVGVSYNQAAELVYFRVVYTNGSTAQTTFRLTTVVRRAAIDPSRYALSQNLSDGYMANVTKSVIWGKTTAGGGAYEQVKVNPSGALTVEADVTSSVLPTGAATEATLSSLNGKVTAVDTGSVTVVSSALPTGAATETTLATLATEATVSTLATESTLSALNNKVTLGAGLNTSAIRVVQASDSASRVIVEDSGGDVIKVLTASTAATASDNSLVVALSPNSNLTKDQGYTRANAPYYNNYASTSVTTSAYTQVVASTTSITQKLSIFDSSGQAMILAVGAGGSEVDQFYIPPGGGDFSLNIPASSRVSIKALTANATSGYILISFLGGA